MGNSDSKSSKYVKNQWMRDDSTKNCYHCGKGFSVTIRRHHCRCCGEIYCNDCWGNAVSLPQQYGYKEPVPVCVACEELCVGRLRYSRHPRRIVMTRALKTKEEANQPPLSTANVQARSFEVFFMKAAHWRPLSHLTHLQFAVSLRVANGAASSAALEDDKERQREVREASADSSQHNSGLDAADSPRRSGPPSPTGARMAERPPIGKQDSGIPFALKKSPSTLLDNQRDVGDHIQLDIAWTLPLDSIINVFMDAQDHHESSFIILETHQEAYRIQVADVEVETDGDDDDDAGITESANSDSTSGNSGKKRVRIKCGPRQGHVDEADDYLTSAPVANVKYSVNPEGTEELYMEMQRLIRLSQDRMSAHSKTGKVSPTSSEVRRSRLTK